MDWQDFLIDWQTMLRHCAQLGIAYVLSLPIAYERELHDRSAGMRTFPLVAVAACGYMLVGISVYPDSDASARVVQGIISGMGFIGGGAILKNTRSVRGLATATSLWGTGAIGIAVAFMRMEIAFVIALTTFLTLHYLLQVKKNIDHERSDVDDLEEGGHAKEDKRKE